MPQPITVVPGARRSAFTLIEMMIVIAILAILVTLSAAALLRLVNTGTQVTLRTEIGQMELGLQTAMGSYATKPNSLPSMIRLAPSVSSYTNAGTAGTLDAVSLNALKSMFGRHFGDGNQIFNWDPVNNPNGDITLEGEEALVFYLGGIPSKDPNSGVISMTGFSKNPTNPTQVGGSRIDPFFDFKTSRLQKSTNFYIYLDPYHNNGNNPQPYAFFSSLSPNNPNGYGNDCPSLLAAGGQSLQPYFIGSQFINPRGFQIISAGADQIFGPGGQWNPKTGYGGGPGNDDTANFSGTTLGAPQSN